MASTSNIQDNLAIQQLLNWLTLKHNEPTFISKFEYQVGGRIAALGISLIFLAGVIVRVALGSLAFLNYLVTLGSSQQVKDFSIKQLQNAFQSGLTSYKCFRAAFSPQN